MGRSSISVRGLAAFAVACALLCAAAASASAAPLIWVPNEFAESVSTYDSSTGKEVGTPIKVGEFPAATAIAPNGRRVIVLEVGGESARVIETGSRTPLKPIPLGAMGQSLAVSPDGKTAYVTASGDAELIVINPETDSFVKAVPLGVGGLGEIAFSPDGTYAYVGTFSETLARVETATQKVVGTPIELGGPLSSLVFTPDGTTAYATASGVKGVRVINTALGEIVKTIPTPEVPNGLVMSPDGKKVYISTGMPGTISVAETATNAIVGAPISLPGRVSDFAVTPDGSIAWVTGSEALTPVSLTTGRVGSPIPAGIVGSLKIAPDLSPTAAFTAPSATVGVPAPFSGAASTDPDGTVTGWSWLFGDGGSATGVAPSNTFATAGIFNTKLSVVDNEGCGEAEVFTGQGAYCSGNVAASVTHPVSVAKSSEAVTVTTRPSNNFRFGRIVHNRSNGTVRMQVKLPSAGFVLLFGKKVHAVTRKSSGVQTMWLTIHARVELAKRLKKTLRAPVAVRITFTPNGGTPKTVHRSVTLQRRAPKKHKHHRAAH
jgi:DNA-binding beta-propeller fold protein YncE